MTDTHEPILSQDPVTGDYIADFRLRVDASIFKRMVIHALEEDETLDITRPDALTKIITRIGKARDWLGKPHTHLSALPSQQVPSLLLPTPLSPHPVEKKPKPVGEEKTKAVLLEEQVRERAQHVPPHRWFDTNVKTHDSLVLSPIAPEDWDSAARADRGRLRYDERKVLQKLLVEWKEGRFVLDPEAAEQEKLYQETQTEKLETKIETMALATNGSRIH